MILETIKNFPNYKVSSCGKVFRDAYSCTFMLNGKEVTRDWPAKPIALLKNKKGYIFVCISNNGSRSNKFVHQLVAEAFIENHHGHVEVDHKDDNRSNNHHTNLNWVSRKENMKKMLERNPHVLYNLKRCN